ncbi:hypothetical protein CH251_01215 [Rhodococcus sp. 06-462-5]|uniref:hypothetical protein n=1 Tax=unclassified Rhodococcus (in: high G+C Gram-positive bacteria) TaxID=192944 RepID=UPI000B9C00A9|nr:MULTISPECIES: hypothetical protein [unclassified Rhodococcus (in: high G+C Gram-positive bacteria)]OZC79529.1 hypothetical protein CH251_01215 [Rhodococcus sp. 06-462-5]OZE60086.1 hypothetical protein CH270_23155 [Rhodococcus sp. 02-925g]
MTDNHAVDADRDVRAFLGMNTASAYGVAATLFGTYSLMNFTASEGVHSVWLVQAAVLVVAFAAFALVAVPGDPLGAGWATAIGAAAPVSTAIVLSQVPVPVANGLQTWPLSAAVALCGFVSVRGRTALGWAAMAAVVAVCAVWSAATDQGPMVGVAMSAISFAPLVMATFFALTFRSTAAAVFELRAQSRRRAAEDAATSAGLDERDRQLEQLDFLARPLLEKIASGSGLDTAERQACGLLEATLRDRLRAPGLMTDEVAAHARAARARGVQVVLLDDGGLAMAHPTVSARVSTAVSDALRGATGGVVTARILPPGRARIASILVSDLSADVRIELDADGRKTVVAP